MNLQKYSLILLKLIFSHIIKSNLLIILKSHNKRKLKRETIKLQKNLKRFHDKLGHLGFQHLKWLLSTGVFGPLGIRCSQADVLLPKCQSCLHGGQHKSPTSGNIHAQDQKSKGIFKAEQLNPSQRVFSDQYVSSKEG